MFRGDGALVNSRDRLENKGQQADSAAPLLINSLHRLNLIRMAGDRVDAEEMTRALQEIGRHAYQFWTEEGLDADRQAVIAEEWARAIESELGPPYKVRVVRPGQPKDNSWMTYKYGGTTHVARVETWCVQGRIRPYVRRLLMEVPMSMLTSRQGIGLEANLNLYHELKFDHGVDSFLEIPNQNVLMADDLQRFLARATLDRSSNVVLFQHIDAGKDLASSSRSLRDTSLPAAELHAFRDALGRFLEQGGGPSRAEVSGGHSGLSPPFAVGRR